MISCNQHDYVELVCMYRYAVKVSLKSGATIQGVALDTQHNENKDECIKIQTDDTERLVILNEVKKIEVIEDNPHVRFIDFN
jgi:Rho-binding antiterminator